MDKKDYEEPVCPMDNSAWKENDIKTIPIERVIAKEDEYLAKNDFSGAEKVLLYWLVEAESGHDDRGRLVIYSELMGLNRKKGNEKNALEYAAKAMESVDTLGIADMVSGATVILNAGTVYKAFGQAEKSLECFEKAKAVYEKQLPADDSRKAGLYNNMALTLVDLKRYSDARDLYMKAIEIVKKTNVAEEAITWLNIADCSALEKSVEDSTPEIRQCIEKADQLLESVPEEQRDGYYAFVCEKCAPVFDYYGHPEISRKLADRAAGIFSIVTD